MDRVGPLEPRGTPPVTQGEQRVFTEANGAMVAHRR